MIGRRTALLLILLAVLAAYSNSFSGVFMFDEHVVITDNEHIRDIWPPWPYVRSTLRPLLLFSVAVNYAIGGLHPWSYHAFNLMAHAAAALLLFGIVRLTLLLPRWGGRHDSAAVPAAFSVALLWAVHPLQTQSVTYVIQRGEVMASAFGLCALWCLLHEDAARGGRRLVWRFGIIGALTLALSAKETAIAMLPVLFVYDGALLSGSWREAVRRRWPLYVGVTVLPATVVLVRWFAGMPMYFDFNFDWPVLTYLFNQGPIILHYLRLAFWPHPLVFDYGWQPLGVAAVAFGVVVVLAMMAGAAASLRRWPIIGSAGVAFFVLLAPTSSILPIRDMAVEHRMYLPLAAVIAIAVAVAAKLLSTVARPGPRHAIASAVLVLSASLLVALTWMRNRDYHDELRMWEDTLAKRPTNARAHYNAGVMLVERRQMDAAAARFERAIALDPEYARAYSNLAAVFAVRGDLPRAEAFYRDALRLNPALAEAQRGMGRILAAAGRLPEAAEHYVAAVELWPSAPEPLLELGAARAAAGDFAGARSAYEQALRHRPGYAEAYNSLGLAWAAEGDLEHAIASYMSALAIDPRYTAAHNNLAAALARSGRTVEANARYREALRLDPYFAEAHHNLGLLRAESGDLTGAIDSYQRALALRPAFAEAHFNLATALASLRRYEEAAAACRRALMLRPDYAEAHNNLGAILLHLHRPHEAARHLETALALRPDYPAAQRNLTRAVTSTLVMFDAAPRVP